ncbi:hypothetical protein [Nocardia sp. NPDC052566]|uniref:hypothetical protein n=1 Tax=Nocardia sp. NPDC052566 TaxID=3364330 RepID=UPI0037C63899
MFAGLGEVDWESADSYYGAESNIPELLRRVASRDPGDDKRRVALLLLRDRLHPDPDDYDYDPDDDPGDALLGSVCMPFLLELALDPLVDERSELLKLIADIAGAGANEEAVGAERRNRQTAREAIGRELPNLLDLLADTGVEVRRAVTPVLAVCTGQWHTVVPALRAHIGIEPDPIARIGMMDCVTSIVRYWPEQADRLGIPRWCAETLAADEDPIGQLTVLRGMLDANSAALPSSVTTIAARAVRRLASVELPDSFSAPNLLSTEEWLAGLAQDVYVSLAVRPTEQYDFLRDLFHAPQPEIRRDACRLAGERIRRWRGEHAELLEAIAEQLTDRALWQTAAEQLGSLGPAATPVLDHILEALKRYPRITEWDGESPFPQPLPLPWLSLHTRDPMQNQPGPLLRAAAGTGDPRALPAVRWTLELDEIPDRLDHILEPLGAHAIGLVPLIHACMVRAHTNPADRRLDLRAHRLARALGRIGEPAAAAAPDIAAMLANDRSAGLVEVLGQLGVGARATVEVVRGLLDHPRPRVRVDAAFAMWRFTGDPEPALARLRPALAAVDESVRARDLRVHAIELTGRMGFAAGDCAPALRHLIDHGRDLWTITAAAIALWRVTGDPDPTVPLLLDLSARGRTESAQDELSAERRPHWLTVAADCFAEIGHAAQPAAQLLTAELARTERRHGTVAADIELCRACRRALDRIFAA